MIGESQKANELIESYLGGQRNFRNANLSGLELNRAHLPEIDLQGAYLRWIELQGANLKLANLPWADLQKANLSDATLQQAMLKEASLRKANLQWADLQEAQLQGANLVQSHLMCANFRGASLRLANLQGADLDKAELSGADLRVANLISAQLRNADLKQAKLQGANLQYANLTGANLEGSNLQGADLTGAKLFGANLQNANLQQANLEGVDLREAQLFGSNLQGANLERTFLPPLENMQGACLKDAQFLNSILPKGQILETAILVNGLISHPTNVAKSLPQSAAPKATKAEAICEFVAEEPTDFGLDASRESLNNLNPQIDLFSDLSSRELSLEAQQMSAESVEPSLEKIQRDLPLGILNRARQTIDRLDNARLSRDTTDNYQTRANRETENFLELIQQRMGSDGHFTSTSLAIAKRRGPSKFRQRLLEAYNGSCSITGCHVEPILEVAFLHPNLSEENTAISNGLLLRADLHTLFDLHLIVIEPETLKVMVAPSLRQSSYGTLHEQPLRPTNSEDCKPNEESLRLRLQWCQWFNASA